MHNLLELAKNSNIERLIQTSTSEVYGTAQFIPMSEKHPINPQSPYAATKASADHLCMSYYYSFGLPITILRPFNTYGPRQSTRAVIPTIINQISKRVSKVKLGSINTTRDFNFVEDTVQAYIKSLKKNKRLLSNGKLNHTYPHSWRSKAPLIHRATPQWFISMESHGLRKKALVAIDKTEFYPPADVLKNKLIACQPFFF